MSLGGYYQYQPLESPDEFRVLILHPGVIEGQDSEYEATELFVDIVHEKLSEEADYVALSYVWGDTGLRGRVFLRDGQYRLPTTSNLRDALFDLRRTDRPLRLWVDALCINQQDVSERGHQVQHMRNIFSCGRETIVYLGCDLGGNTGLSAWNFLESQASWALNDKGEPDASIPDRMRDLTEFRGDISDVECDILERRWFRRVWVFQEVVVSRKVSLQCARRRIPWDDFCKALLLHKRHHDRYGQSLSRRGKAEIVFRMFQARRAYLEAHGLHSLLPAWHGQLKRYDDDGGTHILNTLERARRLEATDPRDKIFALLGISTGFDPDHPSVAPDYSKSRFRVYMDLAAYVMETSQSYDIWSCLDNGAVYGYEIDELGWARARGSRPGRLLQADNDEEEMGELPSWVPDWNRSAWEHTHVPRSILSTFGPETETERRARERVVRERRWRLSPTTPEYVCGGVFIGVVSDPGCKVFVRGRHEQDFQACRDSLATSDPKRCFQEVMDLWESQLLFSGQGQSWTLLDKSTYPPAPRSVESYLFARARKTVSWTDDNSKAVAVISDAESIVDGRRVGSVAITISEKEEEEEEEEEGSSGHGKVGLLHVPRAEYIGRDMRMVGLLPPAARPRDMVVLFDGARLPFVVRCCLWRDDARLGNEEEGMENAAREEIRERYRQVRESYQHVLPSTFGPSSAAAVVGIVGECLVNGYKELAERKPVSKTTFIVV